ncbi:MAG: hypothetical protein A2X78_01085 [Gammaproteobacteria bacterium GWE2_37_16]|nr:MAG: hypothetical protein A2X78_01085 [Gammaproteobacteria bacterium GWE2_37_16]
MLHSFSCENFYSFKNEVIVDFTVTSSAAKNESYVTAESQTNLTKILAVIGYNASGKTHLLKVLPFLQCFLVESFAANPQNPNPIQPFLFGDSKDKPSKIATTFEIAGDIFTYWLELDSQKIIFEKLNVRNKSKKRSTVKTLFTKAWDAKKSSYDFKDIGFDLPKVIPETWLRTNASVISTAFRLQHKISSDIASFWQKIQSNVVEGGRLDDSIPKSIDLINALIFFCENEHLKKEAEKLIARFDLGFSQCDIKKETKDNQQVAVNAAVVHSFKGKDYRLSLRYESSGTKHLLVILKTVLEVLANGGIAVLDEFDANLHPSMVLPLLKLFMSCDTNPKNAQIIFSTHSHRILAELDKQQIFLVEKNKQGISEGWRLDEMEGVRADDNYYAKYIAGAYGAVPNITEK